MQMQIRQTHSLYHASKSFQDGKADDMFTYCKVLQLLPSTQMSNSAKCKVKVDITITPRLKPQYHAQMSRKYVQDPSLTTIICIFLPLPPYMCGHHISRLQRYSKSDDWKHQLIVVT